jgi:hypothetical protein
MWSSRRELGASAGIIVIEGVDNAAPIAKQL